MNTDEETLRQWLDANYKGLHSDRSTASYALEFLKTERANLAMYRAKANIAMSIEYLNTLREFMADTMRWADEHIARLQQEKEGE